MKYTDVQTYLAGCIAANSVLADFGAAHVYSPLNDIEAEKTLMGNALAAAGVFIVIGFPRAPDPKTELDGSTRIDATVDVLVAESAGKSHSPSLIPLAQEVAIACTKPQGGFSKPARWIGHEHSLTEEGYVLHFLSFAVPMLVRQTDTLVTPGAKRVVDSGGHHLVDSRGDHLAHS